MLVGTRTRERYADVSAPERVATALMQRTEVEIGNLVGLDTPASARVARLAAKYQCDVSLSRSGRKVNAKSLMGVAMLAAPRGSRVLLETDGPDEHEALAAIGALIREPAPA